ncbi:hypothetical protein HY357_04000 [Candidatus Roizmanbacteria bacterium]|nr:hypothetical protein [Candidatus Roizmanbacteria bacterium]
MSTISNLSNALQNYYKRKGNKLIFINGQTLNKLALEMWTNLGYKGMDSSIFSKVITGKRLFTKIQLDSFCKILQINEVNKHILENALGKDLLHKYIGESISISDYPELVADTYIKNLILYQIRSLREKGNMDEASGVATFFEKILCLSPSIKKANISLLSKVLNEKVRCLIFTEKPENFISRVKDINNFTLQVGLNMKDLDIISMSHGNIGGSYYVAGKLRDSAGYLEKTFHLVDKSTRVEYIRTLLNNYSFLGDRSSYRKIYLNAEKILLKQNIYNTSHVASIYEALARSSALIGNIKHAKNLLNGIDMSKIETFYQSEINRGKMFVCYQAFLKNKNIDFDEVEHLLKESQQSKFLLFKRHQSQIIKMYKKIQYGKTRNSNR